MQPNSVERFTNRVSSYAPHRPRYPQAVVDEMARQSGVQPGAVIADVGAGTGIFTELLLQNGYTVYAVEPNDAMRKVAEETLGQYAHFTSVAANAEATGLPAASIDLVSAAQAFHWFDPMAARREFARILKPGGWVALVWNERKEDGTDFLRGYQAVLDEFATDYRNVAHEFVINDEGLRRFYGADGFRLSQFTNRQVLDLDGLIGRLTSTSYAPAPTDARYEAMLERVRALFAATQVDGFVILEYRTQLYLGRLT